MAVDNGGRMGDKMRRVALAFGLCLVLVLALLAEGAGAASVHFRRGSPTFTDLGLRLSESVKLTGLGGGNLLVSLSATGIPTAVCSNPGKTATQPPGQNPAAVTVGSGQVSIPGPQDKNGNVTFEVVTQPPPSTIAGAPECPSSNWTETITGVAFTSATLSISQGGQALTLDGTSCTFAPQTADGPVPSATISC
jgi:hypothetical protein